VVCCSPGRLDRTAGGWKRARSRSNSKGDSGSTQHKTVGLSTKSDDIPCTTSVSSPTFTTAHRSHITRLPVPVPPVLPNASVSSAVSSPTGLSQIDSLTPWATFAHSRSSRSPIAASPSDRGTANHTAILQGLRSAARRRHRITGAVSLPASTLFATRSDPPAGG
jgi:hypothetical protein